MAVGHHSSKTGDITKQPQWIHYYFVLLRYIHDSFNWTSILGQMWMPAFLLHHFVLCMYSALKALLWEFSAVQFQLKKSWHVPQLSSYLSMVHVISIIRILDKFWGISLLHESHISYMPSPQNVCTISAERTVLVEHLCSIHGLVYDPHSPPT